MTLVPSAEAIQHAVKEGSFFASWATGADYPTWLARLPQARSGHAEGDVTGSAYAGDAAPPTVRFAAPVHLNATPRALLAWMNATDHEGIPDVDLELRAPNGTVLAFSGTPTPREMIRLGPENLANVTAGDLSIAAISYGSARAHVTIEWDVS